MAIDAELEELTRTGLAEIGAASDLAALGEVRIRLTGRKSRLAEILASVGTLPHAERGVVGKAGNIARTAIEAALDAQQEILDARELGTRLAAEQIGRAHV